MTERRLRAGKMFAKGSSQADVARALEVSRVTASQWHATWREHGLAGLRGAGRAGRLPLVTDEQLERVEEALAKGPTRNGFPNELWTLARVSTVIEKVTGVSYSTTQTWSILRDRLGWSRQRPARRAAEADQDAIAAWARDRWPVVKKRPTPPSVDHLPRRVGVLAPPLGEGHLGAEGTHARSHPPLQLEAALHVERDRLRARRVRRVDVFLHEAGIL
jgi:transposase